MPSGLPGRPKATFPYTRAPTAPPLPWGFLMSVCAVCVMPQDCHVRGRTRSYYASCWVQGCLGPIGCLTEANVLKIYAQSRIVSWELWLASSCPTPHLLGPLFPADLGDLVVEGQEL